MEVITTEKSATLNLRVNPSLKADAEAILTRLGIPFSVTVPKPSADIDASQMTESQLHEKLQLGYDDYRAGITQNAADAFSEFRESHS